MLTAFAAPRKRKTVDDRVYLVHADELKFDMYGPNPDAQIVKGHVHFRHRGATLTCDSAYFYQTTNSVRAMGHVHFRQPQDKITLTCQRAWYDGEEQLMEARNNVVLHHARQTLYTDSLNYDRLYNNAYFFRGGRLIDGSSKLSSDWGEYNTQTKQAVFYYDVQLHTPKTRVSTDTLYYDTRTSRAHVVGQYTPNKGQGTPRASRIVNGQNVITTTDAYFNTKTDKADLYGRSTVVNKEKTITADTLFYNSKTGRNYGRGNVVYVDKRNKNQLTAHLVVYNEKTGRGFATGRALVKDYSRPDTLWMHGDTMRVETFHINTDSAYRKVHCYPRVRIFRNDAQAVCDSLVFNSKDSCMTMYRDPILWNGQRQLLGEKILTFMNDTTIRRAIFYPVDDKDSTLIGLNYIETDTMRSFVNDQRKLERIWMPKAQGTLYPMTQIPPGKDKLDVFAWFDDIRPKTKDDVFIWNPKASGTELKHIKRHAAPIQQIGNHAVSKKAEAPAPTAAGAKSHQTPSPKTSRSPRKRTAGK